MSWFLTWFLNKDKIVNIVITLQVNALIFSVSIVEALRGVQCPGF